MVNISTVAAGLLLPIGFFYTFFPHEAHLKVAQLILGPTAPDPGHAVHVSSGLVALILGLYLIKDKLTPRVFKVILTALLGAMLDVLFHAFFTDPFEVWFYFVVKVILLIWVGWYLTSKPNLQQTKMSYAIIGGLVFAAVFSIYYRINERVKMQPFGSRVPDINIGSIHLTYATTPITSGVVWGTIHFLAYAIPAYFIL